MGSVFLKEKIEELLNPWFNDSTRGKKLYSSFNLNTVQFFQNDIKKIIVNFAIDFQNLGFYEDSDPKDLYFFLQYADLSTTEMEEQLEKSRTLTLTQALLMHLHLQPELMIEKYFEPSRNANSRFVIISMIAKEHHPQLLSIVVQQNNIEDLLQMANMELNVPKETWNKAFDCVLRNQINARGVSAYLQLYDLISPQDRQRIEREFSS